MASQQGSAFVWARKRKILIAAQSNALGNWYDENGVRRGAWATDFDAYAVLLARDASDELLGCHLRQALLASRIDRPQSRYDPLERDRTSKLAAQFGLKSSGAVYQGVRGVSIDWSLTTINLTPSLRRHGGTFEHLGQLEAYREVTIPFDCSNDLIGAALKDCIERSR